MITVYSCSSKETESLGEKLAVLLLQQGTKQAFVALYGEMGVGKTAFVRGFARAFGVTAVKSPTYTVVNEYKNGVLPLFHFDMYRIGNSDDLYSIGYDDYLDRTGICLAEWCENIPTDVPADAIRVTISRTEQESARKITIEGVSHADSEF